MTPRMLNRRSRSWGRSAPLAGGLAALFVAAAAGAPAATAPPNLLFIMVDEMRWNALGCEGHPVVQTPHLDRIAREGTRFATAYTVAPICTPSRYSFFTGRYAHVHGSTDNQTPPREGQVLLPLILKRYGYETALSGKLHFLPAEPDYGFDHLWSFANEGPGKLPRWPQAVEQKHGRGSARRLVEQPFPDDPLGKDLGKLGYPKEDTQTWWITDRAIDYLRQRDRHRPFFLFVSYLDPHSPSHLAEPYWGMFDPAKMPVPPIPEWVKAERAASRGRAGDGAARHLIDDPAILRALTAAYYAKVKLVDDNVGRLLRQLEADGLLDRTLIVFTADHGNMLGDHGRWFKGVMYEGSSRIPLFLRAPGSSPFARDFNRGRVITNIVENIDVMPTVLEILGQPLQVQPGIQGRSLVRLVQGIETDWKNIAYAERNSRMVRTPTHKLIRNPARDPWRGAGEFELYDLVKDPGENFDLATDPAHAAVLAELQAKLEAWQKKVPPVPTVEGVAPWVQTPGTPKTLPRGRRAAAAVGKD